MPTVTRDRMTDQMKALLKVVAAVYDVPEPSLVVYNGNSNYPNMTNIKINSGTTGNNVRCYMGWTYGGYPGCCGYAIMCGLSYKTTDKKKAGRLARAFKAYCVARYGGGCGWSQMWHAVSEQERGYQHPFLRAAGFLKAQDIISRGTQHKLTMVSLDLRTPRQASDAKRFYEERYGDSSVYQLGSGT
jgi:hypothetical protein